MSPHWLPGLKTFAESFGARSVVVLVPGPEPVVCTSGLAKAGAEDLLEWLENHGGGAGEVYPDEVGFTVKFQVVAAVADALAPRRQAPPGRPPSS